MSIVAVGTPLAQALSNAIQPKLVEMGWSSDGSGDSALTEYVILMLVNGKTQDQIASELSNDLLMLGEGDTQAVDFSRWLFEQVEILNQQINGQTAPTSTENAAAQAIPSFTDQETVAPQPSIFDGGNQSMDMSMGEAGSPGDGIPTGPKSMRNGRQAGRGRMINQINRALERGDSGLHRIRDQTGGGRVNSHGRGPKGRFNQNGGGRMPGMRQMGGMGMGNNQMGVGAGSLMNMSQNDQMHLMSLLEEQARMMAQFMPGFVSPAINPAFQQSGPQRSLFDRVERQKGQRQHGKPGNRPQPTEGKNADTDMDTSPDQMAQDGTQDENNTDNVCHFNLRCTRKDCPFAHQSPAAPEGAPIDVSDPCPYGAACKNRKCTARHPSPAVKTAHQAEELCRFFPHCTNPHCHFKHPSMPLCRNGADCSVSGCKFTHLQVPCKFNPCLNPTCPYKHAEGQRGAFADKVWTAESGAPGGNPHVSERKFITDEDGAEELIRPEGGSSPAHEIVT